MNYEWTLIHGERVKLGKAIESVDQHLTSEKSLFSQLRTDVGRALKHAFVLGVKAAAKGVSGDNTKENDANGGGGGGGRGGANEQGAQLAAEDKELAASTRTLDESLSMAKWRGAVHSFIRRIRASLT